MLLKKAGLGFASRTERDRSGVQLQSGAYSRNLFSYSTIRGRPGVNVNSELGGLQRFSWVAVGRLCPLGWKLYLVRPSGGSTKISTSHQLHENMNPSRITTTLHTQKGFTQKEKRWPHSKKMYTEYRWTHSKRIRECKLAQRDACTCPWKKGHEYPCDIAGLGKPNTTVLDLN